MTQTSSKVESSDQNLINPVSYLRGKDADIEIEIDGTKYSDETLDGSGYGFKDVLEEFEFEHVYENDLDVTDSDEERVYEVETNYNHLGREGYGPVDPTIPGLGPATIKGTLEPSEDDEELDQLIPADD